MFTQAQIEQELRNYAGQDYNKPKTMTVGEIDILDYERYDINDVIDAIVKFRDDYKDCRIITAISDDFDEKRAKFYAHRVENEAEVEARIAGYMPKIMQRLEQKAKDRRQQYEMLKREFEGGK